MLFTVCCAISPTQIRKYCLVVDRLKSLYGKHEIARTATARIYGGIASQICHATENISFEMEWCVHRKGKVI